MMYGGPSLPHPWDPDTTAPQPQITPLLDPESYNRIKAFLYQPGAPTRVRVSVVVEGTTVRLKLEDVNTGRLIAEVSGTGTLILETEVSR